MRLRHQRDWWKVLLIALAVLFKCDGSVIAAQQDGVKIDLPRDGQIKIENRFGAVSAEVWNESYVLVSATVGATQKALVTSPIVIQGRDKEFSITVVRRPVDPVALIDLVVKVPETARVEITTNAGAISLNGMTQSASLRSASGEVRALLAQANTDVSVETASGAINSDFPSDSSPGSHALHARLGSGEKILRIKTDSGSVTFKTSTDVASSESDREKSPPMLSATGSASPAGTPARESGNEEVSEGDVVRVDAQLVTLNMSVIDRNTNRGVQGLTQKNFKAFEDGVEQKIVQFDAASAPFDLFLLIDISGSTKDVLKLIREAALHFIDAARPLDRIGVVTFAGKASIVSPLTLDRNTLRERVSAMETGSGDTKLYDALNFTLEEALKQRARTRRTAIVLMSDGLDGNIPGVQGDGSKLEYKEIRSRVQEFDGVLYTLWLNTEYEAMNPLDTQPEAFDAGYNRMKELADDGGGIFYEVEKLDQLAGAYEQVVNDLGTVYSIAFQPTNKLRDGHWRALRVVVDRPNTVARGKRGYYAN
ncbi:MAG: hypothetical protein C5B44_01975 [Acidobacteria bacterium]|nr:MAG: hypothetical protein C5B44_01975 [Acidobacteriota bacterium]